MPSFSSEAIRKIAASNQTYQAGMDYYANRSVKEFHYDQANCSLTALVADGKNYRVRIELRADQSIGAFSCTCPAFYDYPGACKHIVAALLCGFDVPKEPAALTLLKNNLAPADGGGEEPGLETSRALIADMLKQTGESTKNRVKLQATLHLDLTGKSLPGLELQIGMTRLYQVKKLRELIEAVEYQEELPFGRLFSFQPQVHTFHPQDQSLIDFLLDLYREGSNDADLDQNRLGLKPSQLRRFLSFAGELPDAWWQTEINGPPRRLVVSEALPPLTLQVGQGRRYVEIGFMGNEELFFLSPAKDTILTENRFYVLTSRAARHLAKLWDAFATRPDRCLPLAEPEVVTFFTHLAPTVRQFCQLQIAPEVQNRLHDAPLKIVLGLDKRGDGVLLKLRFRYGETEVDPLTGATTTLREGQLLLRDSPAENAFLKRLTTAGFVRGTEGWTLAGGTLVDQFLEDVLPELLRICRVEQSAAFAKLQSGRSRRLDGAIRFKEGLDLTASLRQLNRIIQDPESFEAALPANLNRTMRAYQKTGFKWLKALSTSGLGGILADDMGLGKTLQIIAWVQSEYSQAPLPSLVVAPTSLVYNWREELAKFAPELSVLVLDGPKEARVELLQNLNRYAVVITSYPLLRRDIEMIRKAKFTGCILDEAQHIKNPTTFNARTVKQIQARYYFAVTGTPVENSLIELWSLFDFILPGYLYSYRKFQTRFEIPISRRNDSEALIDLEKHIRPFILRRLKKDVLTELPPKIETKMGCELTREQQKVYRVYLAKARLELDTELDQNGFEKSKIKILALLTRLRQICCHPALFLSNFSGGSGKLELLLELIRDSLASGHRMLIFSQFVMMLDLIAAKLHTEVIPFFRIDGQTPPEKRLKLVNAFNAGDAAVCLISLKAGGTGLNLTGADMVVHYDPWWNPALENQATDRAHRIGQQQVVQVFKLVTRGTIEEKIFALQQQKQELVDNVIKPGESFLGKVTLEEIRDLFVEPKF
jgi:superfamily II DNA or RNA helicase